MPATPHCGPEELVSDLKSVLSELVSKVENPDQSIAKAMGAASTGNSGNGSRSDSA